MSDLYTDLHQRTRAWFERTGAAGWLDASDQARLSAVEQGTPADLFVDAQQRPLVVAFFGGTGVGKSSLLNRVAGAPIARTGIERPTSREVTVFVHQDVELADLPRDLPTEHVRIQRHTSAAHRDVLWLDAPDIDSTEAENRRCALSWLPHVDLVCYVVSPERYRDDVGWRVLGERGEKHGWMFVLNRWDEGNVSQRDDFAQMLREAGLEDPLLLVTCCTPGRPLPSPDQFEQLQRVLAELHHAHGVRELARLGHRARLQALREALRHALGRLGDEDRWRQLAGTVRNEWQAAMHTIREGAEWSMRATAGRFAAQGDNVWRTLREQMLGAARQDKQAAPEAGAEADGALDDFAGHLWDEWMQSKLTACLDATEIRARRLGQTGVPLRAKLEEVEASAAARATELLRDHMRSALARPGHALARVARRGTGFLMVVLPGIALLWVAYAVVRAYPAAMSGQTPFLGSDFAIHSALLVVLAWAVPFTADRLLRPSMERVVLGALRVGLRAALEEIGEDLDRVMSEAVATAEGYRSDGAALLSEVSSLLVKPVDSTGPTLSRVIMRPSKKSEAVAM